MKVRFGDHVTTVETLDTRLDAVIDHVLAIRRHQASLDADMVRGLAEAARLADDRAAADRAALDPEAGGRLGAVTTAEARARHRQLVATEIATATRQSERTVARMMNDAESLVHHYPATLTALTEGQVTMQHARHLIGHADTVPAEARPAFEAQLLAIARTETAYRFDDKARRLRETAHPESITLRTEQARELRGVFMAPECDGMATLTANLPVVEAIAIDDLLDKIARAERSPDDPRTHQQRRADALTRMMLTPDNPAKPTSITASVIITAPAATIAGVSEEPGQLHGYGPIDPDTTRQIAATAPTFLRTLTHPVTGQPTMITRHWGRAAADNLHPPARDRYSAPPELRLVLATIDETCRFPNCNRRANRCELDHTHDWAHGGETTAENLAYLCSRHHHLKHETGWTVKTHPNQPRHLNWTSPHGRKHTTAPPNTPTRHRPPLPDTPPF